MLIDPQNSSMSFPLVGNGLLEFGHPKPKPGTMRAGLPPMMARISMPAESGGNEYPKDWFMLPKSYGPARLQGEFKANVPNMLPEWLLLACYQDFYRKYRSVHGVSVAFVAAEGPIPNP